jgi:hemerythrin-like domain-containing protein
MVERYLELRKRLMKAADAADFRFLKQEMDELWQEMSEEERQAVTDTDFMEPT